MAEVERVENHDSPPPSVGGKPKQRSTVLRDPFILISLIFAVVIALLFVVLPVGRIAQVAVVGRDGTFQAGEFWGLLSQADIWGTLANSLLLAVISAAIGTGVGFIFAYGIHRLNVWGSKAFQWLVMLPLLSPPFSLSISTLMLFGRRGLITHQLLGIADYNVQGLHGLVFVQVLHFFPLAYIVLSGVLASLDKSLDEASEGLGASRWTTFRRITFPLALPGVLTSMLLIMVRSMQDFGNPIVLGGDYSVLVTRAYFEIQGMGDFQTGSLLAFLLLVPSVIIFILQRYWIGGRSVVTVSGKPSSQGAVAIHPAARAAVSGFMTLVVAGILALYAFMIVGAFATSWGYDWTLTLNNLERVWNRGLDAAQSTGLLSLEAAVLSGILGMLLAYLITRQRFRGRRLFEGVLLLPFAIPGILISISYVLVFNQPPLLLTGTAFLVVLALMFRTIPVTIQAGMATLAKVDVSVEEASANLGAGSVTTFRRIALPLMRHAFFGGLTYSFVYATTAVSSVVFLVSAKWKLLSTEILGMVDRSSFSQAAALIVILIGLVLLGVGLLRLFVLLALAGSKYKVSAEE